MIRALPWEGDMRIVLVGHGGREAALAYRLMRSPSCTTLVVTGANPGWPDQVVLRPASTPQQIVELAADVDADLVVCGPEAPLADGLADGLMARGIPCFGPSQAAAQLETSKAFAKQIMEEAQVPTAAAVVADLSTDAGRAAARARAERGQVVVKADGLAAGKGVVVCPGAEEALAALDDLQTLGEAARTVVLEDLLTGPEVSLFALCDGERIAVLPSARDHKQLLDGGKGPNTGGMGAIVPSPDVDAVRGQLLAEQVHLPVVRTMAARGTPFRGLLYAGLMLTPDGPKVLEFNVRFGDPECQPLMALWADDLAAWLHGAAIGELPEGTPRFADAHACCVVLASAGYPASKQVGVAIPTGEQASDLVVFHAGTRDDDGQLVTAGGRVLGLCGVASTPEAARQRAYAALPSWSFDGAQWRTDIGA